MQSPLSLIFALLLSLELEDQYFNRLKFMEKISINKPILGVCNFF